MRIFPLGDSAVTIEFGNEISAELNARSIALAKHLTACPFDGMIETVPAYASVTVFYRSAITFATVKRIIEESIYKTDTIDDHPSHLVEIPIKISTETSPDIERVAEFADLTEDAVIDIFLSRTYRVHMLGFLPGFAYMGEVDERIAAPRLETPRTKVPKGSIGFAG